MAKKEQFEGYCADLKRLATRIQTYLAEHHFEVAFSENKTAPMTVFFIQAVKKGALRTATGTRRSTDISIRGKPDTFEIQIGTGEWGNNLIVSAPLFVIPVVGIAATAARMYSAKKFESNLRKHIREQVELLRNTATPEERPARIAQNQYNCDYIEGYPGWREGVVGGKMILEKKDGADRLIFEAPDGEQITIPASKIEKAAIVLRKKGLGANDLLLEITCKDKNGETISPILNLSDDIITSALTEINQLVVKS